MHAEKKIVTRYSISPWVPQKNKEALELCENFNFMNGDAGRPCRNVRYFRSGMATAAQEVRAGCGSVAHRPLVGIDPLPFHIQTNATTTTTTVTTTTTGVSFYVCPAKSAAPCFFFDARPDKSCDLPEDEMQNGDDSAISRPS